MTEMAHDGPCFHCGASREACDARTGWPPSCCPICQHIPTGGAHARRGPDASSGGQARINGSV
jgi:hypothetical protein